MRIAAALLLLTVYSFAGDTREIAVSPGKRLEVNLETGGTITINGWDKNAVGLNADLGGRDAGEVKIDMHEIPAGVSLESYFSRHRRSRSTSLKFTLNVPRRFDLEIETSGGGIHIDGVEGKLNGTTMGGDLELTNLKGTVRLHTMGGRITLTKSEVDGEVNTNGGKVLLEDVKGNVQGHSMGGSVIYRNVTDRKDLRSDERGEEHEGRTLVMSSMGGELNADDAPYGADLKTMGGDIDIRSAGAFVKAHTMGGDIRIGSIDGWVKAETMGGDVDVTMVGDPSKGKRDVTIISKGGDITLTVPPELSMDVDIAIGRTNGWERGETRPHIESDFPLAIDKGKRDDDDDDAGYVRRYITGTGTIAGGKNRIRIETVNGSVMLKKGK